MEIRIGHETAAHMANYSALVEVASLALGGKKSASSEPMEDLTALSPDAYINRINQLGSI